MDIQKILYVSEVQSAEKSFQQSNPIYKSRIIKLVAYILLVPTGQVSPELSDGKLSQPQP
jgi:hypothetical protein